MKFSFLQKTKRLPTICYWERVFTLRATPEYELSIEQCTPNWFRPSTSGDCTKTIEQVKQEKSKVYFLINKYLDNKIQIYDPIPDICFEGICSIIDKESKPLYADKHHLSDYANSEYLYRGFLSFLEKHKLLWIQGIEGIKSIFSLFQISNKHKK